MNRSHSSVLRLVVTAGLVVLLGGTVRAADDGHDLDRVDAARRMQAAIDSGDLDTAARLAEEVAFAELVDYLDASYTVLRLHCQRKDEASAFATAEQMIDAGFWDFRRLMADPDLTLVTSTDRLKDLVHTVRVKRYLAALERDSRDAMQHPDRIMATLAFEPGDVVADVGAGSGYFTVRVARAVGATGKVIATDIRQEMLDYIQARVAKQGLANVQLLKVEPTDPGLPAGSVDTVLMVDVIHYVKDRAGYARKVRGALAPGGRLVVIDFRYDPEATREFAPPLEQQVPRETLDREMAEAGFEVAASYDFLPEQYFVVYRPAE